MPSTAWLGVPVTHEEVTHKFPDVCQVTLDDGNAQAPAATLVPKFDWVGIPAKMLVRTCMLSLTTQCKRVTAADSTWQDMQTRDRRQASDSVSPLAPSAHSLLKQPRCIPA